MIIRVPLKGSFQGLQKGYFGVFGFTVGALGFQFFRVKGLGVWGRAWRYGSRGSFKGTMRISLRVLQGLVGLEFLGSRFRGSGSRGRVVFGFF